MANYKTSIYQIKIENGYFIETSNNMIFIGISRNKFPEWKGWELIDLKLEKLSLDKSNENNWKTIGKYLKTSSVLNEYICDYYKEKIWDKLLCDDLISQELANIIFEYASTSTIEKTFKLLNILFPSDSKIELIKNLNDYYLLNSTLNFNIDFLKLKLKRYSKILNRYPLLTYRILDLIHNSIIQINKNIDIEILQNTIDISILYKIQKILENQNSLLIESNINDLKQLLIQL